MSKAKDKMASTKKKKNEPEQLNLVDRAKKYFSELKIEWLKVTFPTKKELHQSTIVVFSFTILLMLILSLYDVLMSFVFNHWVVQI